MPIIKLIVGATLFVVAIALAGSASNKCAFR